MIYVAVAAVGLERALEPSLLRLLRTFLILLRRSVPPGATRALPLSLAHTGRVALTALTFLSHRHSLAATGASLGEALFGLERAGVRGRPGRAALHAALIAGVPFLVGLAGELAAADASLWAGFVRLAARAGELVEHVNRFLFVMGLTPYATPWHMVTRARLRPSSSASSGSSLFSSLALPAAIVAIKVAEWLTSSGQPRAPPPPLPVPPPPPAPRLLGKVDAGASAAKPGQCPLCSEAIKSPVVLANSGMVYCLGCLTRFLDQYGECPLTGVRANHTDIRRLFEQ